MSETIALFGGTGNTGKYFLKLALDAGYTVQALIRSPDKVNDEIKKNPSLTLIEGDFSNKESIVATIKDAKYVICMGQGPTGKPKDYPTDFMLNFFTTLTACIQEQSCPSVKVVLYQAGAFSTLPGKPMPMISAMLKTVVGDWMMKIGPNIEDNNKVIAFVQDNMNTLGFQTIVSRPGALKDKGGDGIKEKLKADHFSSTNFSIGFYDLAAWSLEAIKDESLYGTFPYVVPIPVPVKLP